MEGQPGVVSDTEGLSDFIPGDPLLAGRQRFRGQPSLRCRIHQVR
jgi:hypothetical protein